MDSGVDLAKAAREFDRGGVAEALAAAERDRRAVLADFPLAGWPDMPVERYALGTRLGDGGARPFCWLMEYGTDA